MNRLSQSFLSMNIDTYVFFYRTALVSVVLSIVTVIALLITIPSLLSLANVERDNVRSKSAAFRVRKFKFKCHLQI